MRRIVIFDLGGVLIDWNPRYLYRKLFDEEHQMEWFLENVCTSSWNAKQDAGRSFDEAVRLLVEEHPDHEEHIRAYQERWDEMLGGVIEGTREVLAELREQQVPLYALTNWSAETFPIAEERYPFLEWFEGIVVSGEEGMRKPDPAIFRHLIDTHEIEADEAVFIDDRSENVEAARRLGFHGIVFDSPEQLRRELATLGFMAEDDTAVALAGDP